MANRPLLQAAINLIVTTPRTLRRLSPSEKDSLQAEVNKQIREEDISIGLVSVFIEDSGGTTDSLVFQLEANNLDYIDFLEIQNVIEGSIQKILQVPVDQRDFTVDADVVRIFGLD